MFLLSVLIGRHNSNKQTGRICPNVCLRTASLFFLFPFFLCKLLPKKLAHAEHPSGGGQVFGIPIEQCVSNEKAARLSQQGEDATPSDNGDGAQVQRKSSHGSRTSFSSLIEGFKFDKVSGGKIPARRCCTTRRAECGAGRLFLDGQKRKTTKTEGENRNGRLILVVSPKAIDGQDVSAALSNPPRRRRRLKGRPLIYRGWAE